MKTILYTFVVILFPVITLAQDLTDNIRAIDSLKNIIKNTSDSETIRLLYEDIISIQYSTDIDGILESTDAIKKLETTGNCETCKAVALLYEAMHYYLKGELDKAASMYEVARMEAKKVNERYVSNKSLTMLSAIQFYQNDYKKATEYADQLIENELASDSITSGLYDGYFMKGLINDDQSYFSLAIKNYIKADSVNNVLKSSNYKRAQSKLYNNLAIVFIQKKDFVKASYYLNQIHEYYKSEKITEGIYSSKQNLGYLELEKNNYVKAIEILNETVAYYKEIKDVRKESEGNYLLGRAYYEIKEYKKAIDYLESSLQTFKESGATVEAGLNYSYLGDSYLALGNLNRSEENLTKALEIFNEANAHRNQINTLKSFVTLNKSKNRLNNALNNYKQIDSISEIFLVKQNEKQLFELETVYQTKKKEQEIALLTSQKEVTAQKQQNQRNLLIAGISLSSIAGIFFFFQYRNRQKTTKKLQELDKAKSTFFANISHEFRTPLTLIKGPIENMLETASISAPQRNALNVARINTNRMTLLVEQLLALSKLESNQFSLRVSKNSFTTFLKAQVAAFEYAFSEKEINVVTTIENDTQTHWFDHDAMEKVLFNLLGNAAKYTPEKETIFIEGSTQKNNYVFTITNTGTTITDQEARHIFTRFYQTSTFNTGTGIGLALSKELITLHKGTLTLSNKTNKTAFSFSIPIHKNSYTTEEIAAVPFEQEDELLETESISELEINVQNSQKLPQLLIVDDNVEIRHYLQNTLQENYHITLAANGQEGIEKATQNIPDIIISDIMMPTMDGFEMVQLLKENELTAHVPILFITAKTDDDSKLRGLAQGADQYITKPFNNKIVKASLQNILSTRKKLQDRFSQEVILRPKEIAVNSAEERFLEKLQKVFDENITNPEFNTTRFSELMDISRMQLHRKIEGLTGRSTSEFIRLQRIKLAASLLKENDITISEVAYSVGFNDPSYFAKCFKIEMGISPTKYSNK